MSSFTYGKHTPKHIGIWLRISTNPKTVRIIKDTNKMRWADTISRIVVHDYDKETDVVWLEVWCQNLFDALWDKHRYNVFYVTMKVQENWSCEGDLGAGLHFFD